MAVFMGDHKYRTGAALRQDKVDFALRLQMRHHHRCVGSLRNLIHEVVHAHFADRVGRGKRQCAFKQHRIADLIKLSQIDDRHRRTPAKRVGNGVLITAGKPNNTTCVEFKINVQIGQKQFVRHCDRGPQTGKEGLLDCDVKKPLTNFIFFMP